MQSEKELNYQGFHLNYLLAHMLECLSKTRHTSQDLQEFSYQTNMSQTNC